MARERTNETNGIDRASEGWIARAARRSCEFYRATRLLCVIRASSRVPVEEQQPERGDEQRSTRRMRCAPPFRAIVFFISTLPLSKCRELSMASWYSDFYLLRLRLHVRGEQRAQRRHLDARFSPPAAPGRATASAPPPSASCRSACACACLHALHAFHAHRRRTTPSSDPRPRTPRPRRRRTSPSSPRASRRRSRSARSSVAANLVSRTLSNALATSFSRSLKINPIPCKCAAHCGARASAPRPARPSTASLARATHR